MISFHRSWLFIIAASFGIGLLLGVIWQLPASQTANLAFLIAGLLVGVIGIAATLWVTSRERQIRLEEIRSGISETRSAVAALREMATQAWQPEAPARAEHEPRGIASAVSETVAQAVEGITDEVDEILVKRMETAAREMEAKSEPYTAEDLSLVKQQLRVDVQEYARSLAGEIQLMIRVAQLTMLTPVERFLVQELSGREVKVNEWGTTSAQRQGFALNSTAAAKDHLITAGVVEAQSSGQQALLHLATGWTEAIGQYESMYGPFFPVGAASAVPPSGRPELAVQLGAELATGDARVA